jgi:ubiquinone/menaquinone biosynthesis C-methylase UbiE
MAVAGHSEEDDLHQSAQYTYEVLERLIGIHPSDVVLEIGCGVGRMGHIFSGKCSKWIGTDISGRMLKYAAQRLKDLKNIELIELSTVGLKEIPDNSVDVVYCTVVFMHLYEWDRYRYVEESHRVLKRGGRFYFDNVDISSSHGWEVFSKALGYDIDKRPAHIGMTSTGDELYTYALRAGFKNFQIHHWDDAWVGVTGIK